MDKELKIDLATLPELGKDIAGELDPGFFSLAEDDARPAGPVSYELHVQRFGGEVLFQGYVEAPFEFECVRTLQKFVQTLKLPEFAISLEVGEAGEIDATEALREEVLLAFPAYPRCDDADQPMDCEIDSRYLAVDKPVEDVVETSPPRDPKDVWGALDSLPDSEDDGEEP